MTEYRVINGKDFIKAKPTGEIDLKESKKILASLASITKPPADYEILIDIRDVNRDYKMIFTFYEVFEFIKELAKYRSSFHNKTAVVVRNDKQLDNSQFMELCAKNRGLNVKAFTAFEEAIQWITVPIEAK